MDVMLAVASGVQLFCIDLYKYTQQLDRRFYATEKNLRREHKDDLMQDGSGGEMELFL